MKNTIHTIEHWQRILLLPFLLVASAFAVQFTPPIPIIYNNVGENVTNPNPASCNDDIALEDPEQTGYTFGGWFEDEEHTGTPIDELKCWNAHEAGLDGISVFAKWTLVTYDITYELNGSDVAPATNSSDNPATYTIETETFTLADPSRNGYTFDGWFTTATFDEETNVTSISKGSTGNLILYAKWTPTSFSITYNLNGSTTAPVTNSTDNPDSYTVETETITLANPSRNGYSFGGWYTTSTFATSSKITAITEGSAGDLVLYAKWTPVTYKITYELNGSTFAPATNSVANPPSYTIESMTTTLDSPTRIGYSFKGWFTTSTFDDGTQVTSVPPTTLGNLTLYAKWTPVNYNITYELNGSTVSPATNSSNNPSSFTIETATFTLEDPSRDGYTFGGWYTNSSFTSSSRVTSIPTTPVSNLILYAKWTTDEYTITYNLNGGTNSSYNPPTYTIASSTIYLEAASRTGYTFGGWFTTSTFDEGTTATSIPAGSTGDKVFWAKWTPITYTITYLNGTTLELETDNDNRTSYNIETPSFYIFDLERRGYIFGGWYTNSSFSGTPVTIINTGSTGNRTLYSKWTLQSYDITYNLNGGTNSANNPSSYTVHDAFDFADPSREYYSFDGWYTNASFTSSKVVGIANNSTGYVEIFAKWTPSRYTITYHMDGGTNSASNPSGCTHFDQVTLDKPQKAGYDFIGWYKDNTTSISTISNASGNIDLYARWAVHNYNIYYTLYGGTNDADNPSTYSYTDNITLKNPTRANYVFEGWYTENTFKNKVESIDGTSQKVIFLYAKWRIIDYSITYKLNGGTNNDTNVVKYSPGDSVTFLTPTYKGYSFLGWYQDSDFENRIFALSKKASGDTTIYAKWKINTYSVAYRLFGGKNDSKNPENFTVKDSIALAAPTKKGYTFDGWYTDSLFTQKITAIKGNAENLLLYANWKITSYKINYVLDGGENAVNNPTIYKIDSARALLPATKTGYNFEGWFLDSNKTEKISRITSGNTGDITVYAKWSVKSFTVIFLNYDNHRLDTQSVPYGEAAEAPEEPKRDGYKFIGWNADFDKITEDTEIYAVFEKTDGIHAARTSKFSVTVSGHEVLVTGAHIGNKIALLDAQGRLLKQMDIASERTTFSLQKPGIYILRIGQFTQKIAIR